jgi:3-hydroxyisobutyrate dehydrogenase-like beta-hydroxyacid dehydrogenase
VAGDLTPRFEVSSALKDLGLAQEWAGQAGCSAQLVEAAIAAYRRAQDAGFGAKDLIALAKVSRRAPT